MEESKGGSSEDGFQMASGRKGVIPIGAATDPSRRKGKEIASTFPTGRNLYAELEQSVIDTEVTEESPLPQSKHSGSSQNMRRRKPNGTTNGTTHNKAKRRSSQESKRIDEFAEFNHLANDVWERLARCLSLVLALCFWVVPVLYWLFEEPDILALNSNANTQPSTANLIILQPISESWTSDTTAVWLLNSNVSEQSRIQIEVFLDGFQLLQGDSGQVLLPAATPIPDTNPLDFEPFRLSYEFGQIPLGPHNLTIFVTSLESPPRFSPYKNASFFAKYADDVEK